MRRVNVSEKMMDLQKIEGAIEAILFTMGEAVEVEKIAVAIEHDKDTTRKLVRRMMDKYQAEDRGIRIIELEDSFQLCSKTEYYDILIKVAKQPKKYTLTDIQLEVLSIAAYKQPVTRAEIEKIRGVNSDSALNKLVEYGLVQELGRLNAPGRPMLFGTTEDFLRNFGVSSIEDLPMVSATEMADFEAEAEEEVQIRLGV